MKNRVNVTAFVNELRNKPALKIIMDSYQDAWNLRSAINMRLRTEQIKKYFSSSVIFKLLLRRRK